MVISRLENGLLWHQYVWCDAICSARLFCIAEQPDYRAIARGTLDAYGDGRSVDGYGMGVDILLTTEAEHLLMALPSS